MARCSGVVAFSERRQRHPFYMHSMIHSQPDAIREALDRVPANRPEGLSRRTPRLVLTGCGTSFHGAMYGARILQSVEGGQGLVEAIQAYDLAYGKMPRKATVLGVSHSGTTPTTNRAL